MPGNKKFICPFLKSQRKVSIEECFGCPFVAATVEEDRQIISITCGFPEQAGERIDRFAVKKIERDGIA